MSEEVFVQVDNKAGGKLSLAFGFGAIVMVAGIFMTLGRVFERLDRVERDVDRRAVASEVSINIANVNYQLQQLVNQVGAIQLTLQQNTRPNAIRER